MKDESPKQPVLTIEEAKAELDQLKIPDMTGIQPGWYPLLAGFFRQLKKISPGIAFQSDLGQIKQKLGTLRIYFNHVTSAREQDLISLCEYEASYTCEFCGKPGRRTTRNGTWIVVSCQPCSEAAEEERNQRKLAPRK